MAETSQIARMAIKLSEDIFQDFFWSKIGGEDQNWPCEKQELHAVKTHPTDVVFYYDDPYQDQSIYVQCDLKSYASDTIVRSQIEKAIVSLSKQLACAEISEEWQNRYTHQHTNFGIAGLLFVYNHDGGYDRQFPEFLNRLKLPELDIPRDIGMWVLGPIEIHWLHNVVIDMQRSRGKDKIPGREQCSFFYPQPTNRAKQRVNKRCPATLEMLTGPWIILQYGPVGKRVPGIVIYIKNSDLSIDAFLYLIDYLRSHELLNQDHELCLKSFDKEGAGASNLQKAKTQYIEQMMPENSGQHGLSQVVSEIKFEAIDSLTAQFSDIALGMEYAE